MKLIELFIGKVSEYISGSEGSALVYLWCSMDSWNLPHLLQHLQATYVAHIYIVGEMKAQKSLHTHGNCLRKAEDKPALTDGYNLDKWTESKAAL